MTAIACAASVLVSAQDVSRVPNWPREAEQPDAPRPKPAPPAIAAMVGEYQGPMRDGTAPRLYLVEQDGRAMYIVDRGETKSAANVRVMRSADRRVLAITIDGIRYERQQVGPGRFRTASRQANSSRG
jgi:hypothetical protein